MASNRPGKAALVAALALVWSVAAHAHCDTLDGPVVGAARKALEAGNVNLVLVWVKPADEALIRDTFKKTMEVRKGGAAARDLADTYLFETLVRIHRAGEGADYTGLKPAGTIHPAVAAADRALAKGMLDEVQDLVSQRTREGLERNYHEMMSKHDYSANDVAAGRAFASAYVEYVLYVERLYDAADTLAPKHEEAEKAGHSH